MATLPPGWAVDYDGQRWLYCYTATSHTQYHFPQPGDEFPDFSLVDGYSINDGLLPEERLESERQVRKRAALRGAERRMTNGKRIGEDGNDRERQDDKENDGGDGTFSFDSFGYLGPGSFSETMSLCPTVDGRTGKAAQRSPSSGVASKLTSVVEIRTGISEGKGEGTKPPVSGPSTSVYNIVCDPIDEARSCQPAFPPSDSSFLCNREISPFPAGTIAELVSESTGLCEEEINPPPVELPATGASWLESGQLPNLVNHCPFELPTVDSPSPLRRSIATDEDGEVQRPGQETDTLAGIDAVDDNRSAWCTNWMSTSTEAEVPPRPPKVLSQFNLPSRQAGNPQLPSKTPTEEKLHQEILDFFPAALPLPEDTKIAKDAANSVFSTMHTTETRHPSIPPNTLSHFPSVLRPGLRVSSQKPGRIAQASSQDSGTSSSQTLEAKPPPANNGGPQFRAFQPRRPQDMTAMTGVSDPPPPHVIERQTPAQVRNEVLAIPDPKDFVRGTALFPRRSTLSKLPGQH